MLKNLVHFLGLFIYNEHRKTVNERELGGYPIDLIKKLGKGPA